MSLLDCDSKNNDNHCTDWTGQAGVKVDLHCHTTFSDETLRYMPGLVYHPLLEPEESYDVAKSRGMHFVTITDHDTIDGCKALMDRRGPLDDFFFGEEVSVRFPEDGTVVHVNVFDHDDSQHAEIQRLRDNIYDFVDYVQRIGKLYVLNHLTWTAQHRVLTAFQLETIMRLFPTFEALNGTRSYAHNAFVWHATQGRAKTLIGGSDSHSNRIGTTYTLTRGSTKDEMLGHIMSGNASPHGAFGTPEKMREDVWLVLQKNVERRTAEATHAWERMVCRVVQGLGRRLHPLVLLGYHKHQDVLIRGFMRSLVAEAG